MSTAITNDPRIEALSRGMVVSHFAGIHPDAPAVIAGDLTVTFAELNARANQLVRALGGSADFGSANNLLAGFFVAPEKWRGLGVGFHMSGTFGAPVTGDFGDQYIFNAYNVGVAAKYYPLSRQFNRGFYGRGSVGFGQFTTKRFRQDTNFYRHQYALGSSLMGALGYSVRVKGLSVGLEAEVESASRSGTVDGLGSQTFKSGQLGVNLVVSF